MKNLEKSKNQKYIKGKIKKAKKRKSCKKIDVKSQLGRAQKLRKTEKTCINFFNKKFF